MFKNVVVGVDDGEWAATRSRWPSACRPGRRAHARPGLSTRLGGLAAVGPAYEAAQHERIRDLLDRSGTEIVAR